MKKIAAAALLFLLALALIPAIAIGSGSSSKQSQQTAASAQTQQTETKPTDSPPDNTLTFKMYDKSQDKIIEVSDKDFCYGALAAQMDTQTEKEALKAQAVALYSYYGYIRAQNRQTPPDNLKGADFSCNTKIWQVYTTKDEIKTKWGSSFDKDYKVITDAVDEVFGKVLTYNGTLARTEFFAISSGTTESSKDIYGEDLPYLTNVASPYDLSQNNYETNLKMTTERFNETLKKKFDDYTPGKNPADAITA